MAAPKTLLEMSGAPRHPSAWDKAALVLIDQQREYVDGALPLPGVQAAIAETAKVLELARKAGAPIIHVVHHGRPGGGLFNPEGPMAAIVPELTPRAGETVLPKSMPNSFTKTNLAELLKASGRTEIVVTGFMTHMCVSATVRSAVDHGYRVTLVANAAATRDLPDPLGGVQSAATVHRATLAALADRFAIVVADAEAWA
jgi:nicotinamidase-related amidase